VECLRLKNNKQKQMIFFALENIREEYGGPIRSTLALMEFLSEQGYAVAVLQANFNFSAPKDHSFRGYSVYSLWDYILKTLLFGRKRPVIIFNNQWTPGVQVLAVLTYLRRVQYIWYVRGNLTRNNFKKKIVWKFSQRFLLRRAYSIIVSSPKGKLDVLQDSKVDGQHVVVIPNILVNKNFEESKPEGQNSCSISKPEKSRVINGIYIGRIHRKKQVHEIIKNLNIKKINGRFILRILGYCNDLKYLQDLYEYSYKYNVCIQVYLNVSEEVKVKFLSESDVFISMSDSENFGISIFEALWVGLPVVIRDAIDFWPSAEIDHVFAIDLDEMTNAINEAVHLNKKIDHSKNAIKFRVKWAEVEKESQQSFLSVIRKSFCYKPSWVKKNAPPSALI